MVLSFPEPRRTPTRMKRLFFRSLLPLVPGALALPVWAAAGATPLPQGGASIALDAARSLVQPGAVSAAAVPDAPFFTLAEWKTPQQPTRPDAVFTLQFEAPVTDGSVLVYDAGKVEAQTAPDTWVPLHDSLGEKAHLRVMPFPADTPVTALRFSLQGVPVQKDGVSAFEATLPTVTVLPERCINVAPDGRVTVSSQEVLKSNFRPEPWRNKPETLNDAFVDARRNFNVAPWEEDRPPEGGDWFMLAWDEAQTLSHLAVMRGVWEKGIGDAPRVERYTGTADPRYDGDAASWEEVPGTWSKPQLFRSAQWFRPEVPIRTQAVRLSDPAPKQRAAIGEIVALREIGDAPVATPLPPEGVPITFAIPEAANVTIQVRDKNGTVIANPVAGVPFTAGEHTVWWNLDTLDDVPLTEPGEYTWKGLYSPGLGVAFRFTYYPTPLDNVAWDTPDRTGGWMADHEGPRTICRGADGTMWLGAFAEGGSSILQVDEADMRKRWGMARLWLAVPQEICTDGEFYYGFCEGHWIKDAQAILEVNQKTKQYRKIFQRPMEAADPETGREATPTGVTGFQVIGNRAFVSFGDFDCIEVFDLSAGKAAKPRLFSWDNAYKQFEDQKPILLKRISIPKPGRLRRLGENRLITTSGKDVVTLRLDTYETETLFAGRLTNPMGLGVSPDGTRLFIGEGEPLHQVFEYTLNGECVRVIGKPGRRKVGAFDFDDLEEPYGVEVDTQGRVWVMEHHHYPKRVSLWDPESGRCVRHVVGPPPYGGGGCIDPENELRLFHRGLEFVRDPATGAITLTNLIYRPDAPEFATFAENNFPCYAFRTPDPNTGTGSRLWFTSHMWPHNHPVLVLWEYKTDKAHVQPVAAVGSAFALRPVFGVPDPPRNDRVARYDTTFLRDFVPGYDPDARYFAWTDRNDDGFVQPEELSFRKLEHDGTLLKEAAAGWLWRMNRRFETAASDVAAKRVISFRPSGFTAQGYPLYTLPTNTLPGYAESFMPDGKGNIISLLSAMTPDGKPLWRYTNRWPGLHQGHRTTARGDEPGVVIAPTRIWGIEPVNEEIGEVVCFNSNLGCVYLMTAEDGLFIDRVFRDQRVGLLWNTETPPAPEVLAETSLNDEHFGGIFQKVRGRDGKDRFCFVAGKHHCSVIELSGLERVRRLRGGTVRVSPEALLAAQARRQEEVRRKTAPLELTVRRVRNGSIAIDGHAREWPKERTFGFALAYDETNLYVLCQTRDPRATFRNKGENPAELFKSGDVVDVMLQTDPGARKGRRAAGQGDIRLSFSEFQGKPVCVLYDFKVPGGTANPVPFSSPWRTIWCDRVTMLEKAKISVLRQGAYYTLEAAVPLADIHLQPETLGAAAGDVGFVRSDDTATGITLREYWSNKDTALLSDLPHEASLAPNLWGLFRYEPAPEATPSP